MEREKVEGIGVSIDVTRRLRCRTDGAKKNDGGEVPTTKAGADECDIFSVGERCVGPRPLRFQAWWLRVVLRPLRCGVPWRRRCVWRKRVVERRGGGGRLVHGLLGRGLRAVGGAKAGELQLRLRWRRFLREKVGRGRRVAGDVAEALRDAKATSGGNLIDWLSMQSLPSGAM